jgi:Flp pilus assembly protein TadG
MRVHSIIALKDSIKRFLHQRDASVMMTFSLALIPIMAAVGAAIDFSRATNLRTEMQAALDAAVLAGARDNTADWANVALNVFNSVFQPKGGSTAAPTFNLNANGTFTGSTSGAIPTSVLGVVGVSTIPVNATSTAMVAPTSPSEQYCVLALNLTASPSVQITGNGSITIKAPNCVLQVNSNAGNAVDLSGNAAIKSSDNCFVGGVRAVGNSSVSPPPLPVCKTVPDPFANYPKPTVGACNYTNYQLSGNKTVTLQPGVYCGGMTFSGPVNVTFAPGLFIVKDGTITESGGSFTGNGVTFFLTGLGAGIALSGQANWHLVAPSDGPFPGFVIFLDPSGPSGPAATSSQLAGQSELYFEGVIYLPKQLVSIVGTATAFAPSPWTSFIADTIQISGNGQFVINNDTSLTRVPIPVGLQMRSGGRMWLTQ